MKTMFAIVFASAFSLTGFCQLTDQTVNSLYEMGVEKKKDSLFVSKEVIRLFTDPVYRRIAYPATYEWVHAVNLLKEMQLKTAFWHMINLYGQDTANRSLVIGTFVAYDSLMQMDQVLLSTYYTYAFADPRISRVINNKPDINRPDLLEKGLKNVKEIINYLWYYRQQRTTSKK
jgi:hypothetical protein